MSSRFNGCPYFTKVLKCLCDLLLRQSLQSDAPFNSQVKNGRIGIFTNVFNVEVQDILKFSLLRRVNGITVADVSCGRCGMLLGLKLIDVPRPSLDIREGRFLMKLFKLVYFSDDSLFVSEHGEITDLEDGEVDIDQFLNEQIGGANVVQVPNEQVGEANVEQVPLEQVGGAYVEQVPLEQVGGAYVEQVPIEQVGGAYVERVRNPDDHDGGSSGQVQNEQVADEHDGGAITEQVANEQDGGADERDPN
ncbi:hypothetical protein CQW23_15945 [Capsicum baccatum]|uniref:Yippee domain-containing protein n=1 Tax=Capsicum baccatum TaxID=33114 RepID=A0A2G2WNG9_CAPBA|nr:hypothetical protein CQW23_15945 [Capsicum baccatum]